MPELIAVITIAGVLAAVAVPRLTTTSASFDEVRLYDQTLAGLRYAQKSAVAMQRNVCAIFTATQLTLRYRGAYGAGACNTDLMPPGGGGPGGLYTVTAQGAAGYGASLTITYDRTGKPDAGQTISLNGGRQIVVEAETGYAR